MNTHTHPHWVRHQTMSPQSGWWVLCRQTVRSDWVSGSKKKFSAASRPSWVESVIRRVGTVYVTLSPIILSDGFPSGLHCGVVSREEQKPGSSPPVGQNSPYWSVYLTLCSCPWPLTSLWRWKKKREISLVGRWWNIFTFYFSKCKSLQS